MKTKNKDFFGKKYSPTKLIESDIKKLSNKKINEMILKEVNKIDFIVLLGALWHHLHTKGEWDLMIENEQIVSNLLKLRNELVGRS